jgi:hypothetical protein
MADRYKSKYYTPDGSKANPDAPASGFAEDPTLVMLWQSVPQLTGEAHGIQQGGAGAGGSGTPPQPSPHNLINVALSSIVAAERDMLGGELAVVTRYNELLGQVRNAIADPGFYGQLADYVVDVTADGTGGIVETHSVIPEYAKKFAEKVNPAMTRVLRQVADTMTVHGVFVAMLNMAGQSYTLADKQSVFPPPTP